MNVLLLRLIYLKPEYYYSLTLRTIIIRIIMRTGVDREQQIVARRRSYDRPRGLARPSTPRPLGLARLRPAGLHCSKVHATGRTTSIRLGIINSFILVRYCDDEIATILLVVELW